MSKQSNKVQWTEEKQGSKIVPEKFKQVEVEWLEGEREVYKLPVNRFQKGDQHSDITLVVGGLKLRVHKSLLMLHSPVFERMLLADFKEKGSEEIELPGKKYSAMVDLLEQIYPGNTIDSISGENIEDLLQLADEYDVQQVFTNCTHFIARQLCGQCSGGKLSTDDILFYLGQVERYKRLHSLRETLVYRASQIPAQDMEQSKYFLSVPATATRDALLQQIKSRCRR